MPAAAPKGEQTATVRALWSALDAAAAPMSTLILTAGLVRVLSPEDYGVMVIALAASGLVTAINPAIAATTTKFVSEARGRSGDVLQAARVMTASLITVVAMNAVLLLAAACFREPLVRLVFGIAPVSYAGSALLMAVLAIGIQQIDAVIAAGIRGCERFRRQALLEFGARMALAVGVIVLAWRTGDVLAVIAAQCVVCALFALVRAAALRNVIPGMRIFVVPGATAMRAVVRFGSWMWLAAIAGVAYGSADRIIVGRVLGTAVAGRFNVDVQIAQLVHYIPSSLFAFCLPAFSRLSAGGYAARGEISRTYRRYLYVIIATAACLAVSIVLARRPLLQAVGGTGFDVEHEWTLVLLVVGFLVLSVNVAAYYLLLALGRSKSASLIMTVSMLAALVLMIFLIPRYGTQGAAVGRLVYALGALSLIGVAARNLDRHL
jgi:O-antigen/teichoic acid export membrane protein